MEDSHIACLDMKADLCDAQISDERQAFLNGIAVFGVFDGHGGKNNPNNTHICINY
jgi:serine/threonine protein phosphatase PrpC